MKEKTVIFKRRACQFVCLFKTVLHCAGGMYPENERLKQRIVDFCHDKNAVWLLAHYYVVGDARLIINE